MSCLNFYIYIKIYSLGSEVLTGFDNSLMFWVHQYRITQNGFTVLKNIPVLYLFRSLPSPLTGSYSPYCLCSFALSRLSSNWNHTVCMWPFQTFLQHCAFEIHLFMHIFLCLDSLAFISDEYAIVWMFIPSLIAGYLGHFPASAVANQVH